MEYRRLGESDLEVSEISLGSWLTYSGGVEREHTDACTRKAFDVGINFFDTSNIYGSGASERAWGEILSDFKREEFILATKVYFPMSDTDSGLSADQISKQLDASLERLQTDYVDLYQCHRFDIDTPIEETMEALTEAVESGKARYIGFSEWTPEQIAAAVELEPDGMAEMQSSQPQYNMIWRAPEAEVLALCREAGISQIVWSPLGQGVLTGKYAPGEAPPPDSRAASDDMSFAIERYLSDEVLERRAAPGADRDGGGADDGADGARLGAPPRRGCLGHHRRLPPRAGRGQRFGVGHRALAGCARGDRRSARRCRHLGAGAGRLRPRGRQAPPVTG